MADSNVKGHAGLLSVYTHIQLISESVLTSTSMSNVLRLSESKLLH